MTGTRLRAARIERWPVAGAFVIARGAKTEVDVVVATLADGDVRGRGEATAIYYHGETAESVRDADAGDGRRRSPAGASRADLQRADADAARRATRSMPRCGISTRKRQRRAGVAAGRAGRAAAARHRLHHLARRARADGGGRARRRAARYPLLKLKLAGEGDAERVAAVRRGAPARAADRRRQRGVDRAATSRRGRGRAGAVRRRADRAAGAGRARTHLLDGVNSPIPLCADESCQDRSRSRRAASAATPRSTSSSTRRAA